MVELAASGVDPTAQGIDFSKSYEKNLQIASPLIAEGAGQLSAMDQLELQKAQLELQKLGFQVDQAALEADPFFQLFGGSGSGSGTQEFKQTQLEAATFANRIEDSMFILQGGEGDGQTVAGVEESFLNADGKVPITFGARRAQPEWMKGEDLKRLEQAERNFINAVLRRESGAAISDDEFNNAEQQYFIQPGDTAEVIRQKRENRQAALDGLIRESGGAYGASSGTSGFSSVDDFLNSFSSFNNDLSTSVNGYGSFQVGTLPKTQSKTTNAFGSGIITGYGSKFWTAGLDYVLPGGKDADVKLKVPVKVVAVREGHNGGFGNQVRVVDPQGKEIWISHLDRFANGLREGMTIPAGAALGKQGNTGNTYGKTGIHLDITMPKTQNVDYSNKGNNSTFYTAREVAAYLGTGIV